MVKIATQILMKTFSIPQALPLCHLAGFPFVQKPEGGPSEETVFLLFQTVLQTSSTVSSPGLGKPGPHHDVTVISVPHHGPLPGASKQERGSRGCRQAPT